MQTYFLTVDSSWRVSPVEWGPDYNSRLKAIVDDEPPALTIPCKRPPVDTFRVANDNGLRLLDFRQASAGGMLPQHICGPAFWHWEKAETGVKEQIRRLGAQPNSSLSYLLEDSFLASIRIILKWNFASLALVDGSAPQAMRFMAPREFEECRRLLDSVADFDADLEDELGLPSPTRVLRNSVNALA